MAERTYQRIHCKIDDFPEEAREAIDRMLADPTTTYTEIAETMTARGFEISKSAIHRYAARMGADQQRLREIGEQTKRLVQSLKDNQDVEATEVANALLLDALTRRIATAEEEFDALPLDKAGRLLVSLQRSTVYKARTMEDKRRLVARMQDTFLSQLREQVRGDEELTRKLAELVAKAGQGTRISFSSGRNESALRQGFAAQNAWDAAALRGKSSRQTPDDESFTAPLGSS